MVLFDSPSEWIGKPVQTGERVMRVADPDAVEIEAWVPVGDAIPLAEGAPLRLYLAADPLTAVQGRVRYMATTPWHGPTAATPIACAPRWIRRRDRASA